MPKMRNKNLAWWWSGLVVSLLLAASLGGTTRPEAYAQATPTQDTATPPGAYLTEFAVKDTTAPRRDVYAVFARLKGVSPNLPRTTTKRTYQVGDQDTFNVADLELKITTKVTATAVAVTPHVYMFLDNRLNTLDKNNFVRWANQFEDKIYPTTRQYFGPEDSPGVDNDPHLVILNTPLKIAAGYFSSDDLLMQSINPTSNEREMFFIDPSKNLGDGYLATLAHEFQHMINNHSLPDQDVWLNEGASVLSQVLNGYSANGLDGAYFARPSSQLDGWTCAACGTTPYYGGGYTFLSFIKDRYGFNTVRSIPQNGKGLAGFNAVDFALYSNGQPNETSETLFKKFVLANYLNRRTADPLYNYSQIGVHVDRVSPLTTAGTGDAKELNQFAADYYTVQGNDNGFTLDFKGATTVPLAGPGPHSGQMAWWSNRSDNSDMTLTRTVDLRGVSQATLTYWTWFDIEPSYDWLYLEASTDNGQTWQPLKTAKYTTDRDLSGKAYGPGMTGQSVPSGLDTADTSEVRATWVQDSADLSKYAGKQIKLRLEYLTDEGYSRNGALFDDFEIPEIGWKDDVEGGEDGWEAAGFVRSDVTLPQRFWVQVISRDGACADAKNQDLAHAANGQPCIQEMTLDAANAGKQSFPYKQAVVVVAPYATHTLNPAHYTLKLAS
jgi:hypothetical protein